MLAHFDVILEKYLIMKNNFNKFNKNNYAFIDSQNLNLAIRGCGLIKVEYKKRASEQERILLVALYRDNYII